MISPRDNLRTLEFVARPTPVYIVGDSLGCVLADRVYQITGDPRRFLARTKYIPGITVESFADANGMLHPDVLGALKSECIAVTDVDDVLKSIHRAESHAWRYAAATMGQPRRSPIVVLMCGSLDVAQTLYALGPEADFALPEDVADMSEPAGTPVHTIATDDVVAMIERRVTAFERGLHTLDAMGFEDLFVHSTAPTSPDDAAFANVFGFPSPARLRYKIGLLFNDRLARASARAGVQFLDLWQETMAGQHVRPEYALDVCHFNDRGALLTMERVLGHMRSR